MPWRGPEFDGELPSLGWLLLDWWADYLPSPRDPDAPLIFTDEQARILVGWYTIDPTTGRYLYRRGQSRRSKGWGKSPVEAAKCVAELAGPVRFDGWDAAGEPVGRPWGLAGDPDALVQIAAVSEDQTENTHSVVYSLLTMNDGAAADALRIDAGLTRSYLRDGNHRGTLEPVTAAFGSREGQPLTYGCLDETHLWNARNGGRKLAATIRRNVGKMGGRTYETTNAYDPGDLSVAQATEKASLDGAAGVFVDAVEAPRLDIEESTDAQLRTALAVAYGDSWWVDLDRIVAECRDPDTTLEDRQRFYFNWNVKSSERAVDPTLWANAARPGGVPDDGAFIGVGFDGSISGDTTALVGSHEGRLFEIAKWERPDGDAGVGWRVPRLEVRAKVAEVFDTWRVGRMLCDPPKWHTEIEEWAQEYGEDVVLFLETNSTARFAPACDRFLTDLADRSLTHDASETLTAHVLAMGRKKVNLKADDDDGRTRFVFVKSDTRKIDAGVAAVLAHEAESTMPAKEEEGVLVW